jgi:hypothetical protein
MHSVHKLGQHLPSCTSCHLTNKYLQQCSIATHAQGNLVAASLRVIMHTCSDSPPPSPKQLLSPDLSFHLQVATRAQLSHNLHVVCILKNVL